VLVSKIVTNLLSEHSYAYPFASTVDPGSIRLAACDGDVVETSATPSGVDDFFCGRLQHPRAVATMLLTLSQIVRTHFFDARPPQMDPIVTASRSLVRWEGFSGCCGVYARLDLEDAAFQHAQRRFGTTNVDFNPAMISHLGSVGRSDDVQLSISADAVDVQRNESMVSEKKVSLPKRWIKGLCEVQVYQSRLQLRHRFSPAALMPLLQNAARATAATQFLTLTSGKPRLAARQTQGAVAVGGASRLIALRSLLPIVREVSLYADEESGVHAWVGDSQWARFWLVCSPALHRGFSGEGQVLQPLANEGWQDLVASIRDALGGSGGSGPADTIDPAELASRLGCASSEARDGLAALATRGLAGFDAASGYYFQRKLPFDTDRVDQNQPRLKAAKKLIDSDAVRIVERINGTDLDVEVINNDITYFVRLRADGDRCTCPWFSRHQGQRGPCKHVLAARMITKVVR
jgi:hypothetical protein